MKAERNNEEYYHFIDELAARRFFGALTLYFQSGSIESSRINALAGARALGKVRAPGAAGASGGRRRYMKNKAIDLHNILFEQLERLNDLDEEEMKSDKLVNEIKRADAIGKVSAQLISNGRMVLDLSLKHL